MSHLYYNLQLNAATCAACAKNITQIGRDWSRRGLIVGIRIVSRHIQVLCL